MALDNSKTYKGFGTNTIHGGQEANPIHGAVTPGIELSTTYAQKSPGVHRGYEYSRTGNPTRHILEKLLAKMENGKYGLCFASGSATTTSVLSILQTGDHVICIDDVYGGTQRYMRHIGEKVNGMKITFLELTKNDASEALEKAIQSNKRTRMLWLESPTNPMLKVADIPVLTKIAHKYNLLVVIDNTFATSYNQRPLDMGVDIVVHSITKYLNGHSDVVMGCAITNQQSLRDRLHFVQNSIGAVPAPFDCYMVIRGMKTLHLRMQKHADNALAVAKFLEKHPKIEKVIYPHLPSHPNYNVAKKCLKTGGGMITILLKGGIIESRQFLENLKLFSLAESLGAVESLAEHPAIMTHASVPSEQRAKLGIFDNLVRLSVGVEDLEDLIDDLKNGLEAIGQNKTKGKL